MSVLVPVRIGTDDDWSDPQMVRMDVNEDLTVFNVEQVYFPVFGKGIITRSAVRIRGAWQPVNLRRALSVRDGDAVCFEMGALRIEPFDHERPRPELPPSRRRLERPRRRLSAASALKPE